MTFARHVRLSVGVLLALATVQVLIETVALLWVWHGQVLPPYGFFPNQLYDFLAKLRYFLDPVLGWMPALPDSFLSADPQSQLEVLPRLFSVNVCMALVLGTVGGVVGATVAGRREIGVAGYLLAWAVLALFVHIGATVPAFSFADDPSLKNLIYRARSLIVDGTVVALVVLIVSAGISALILGRLASSPRTAMGMAVAVVAVTVGVTVVVRAPLNGTPATVPAGDRSAVADYNVLLISLDSLRADHLGCYGYFRETSPNIDALASQGVRFANAIAPTSWTLPSHLTVFTSRYQISHGVVHDSMRLDPSVPILGEIMSANGYSTAGFVSAPYVAKVYGFDRGMDVYENFSAELGSERDAHSMVVSGDLTRRTISWLDEHHDERFFLFVHNFDIHYDYIPPAPYDSMFDPDYDGTMDGREFIRRADVRDGMNARDLEHIIALYDGEIRYTDEYIGKLLERLDELGVADRTLVVLFSDHGDEFFEHHNKGHHRTVYDEVLEVPLIIRFPDGALAGTVIEDQVGLIDIMPTVFDFLGVEGPTGMEGISLLPVIDGRSEMGRSAVYAEFFDKRGFNVQIARRTLSSKVIQHFGRITHPRQPAVEYFDLETDAAERHNLRGERTREVHDGLGELARWAEERWRINRGMAEAASGGNRIELDSVTKERLRSLGYGGN